MCNCDNNCVECTDDCVDCVDCVDCGDCECDLQKTYTVLHPPILVTLMFDDIPSRWWMLESEVNSNYYLNSKF